MATKAPQASPGSPSPMPGLSCPPVPPWAKPAPVLRTVRIDTAANGWVAVLHSAPGVENPTYVFSTVDDMAKWLASQVWEMRK